MKMALAVLIIIAVLLAILFIPNKNKVNNGLEKRKLKIGEQELTVEIADTPKKRQIGLMNRKYMGENVGMLFIFDAEGIYPFWMKDTHIPLDIMWLNKDMKIVYIKENVPPCKSVNCDVVVPTKSAKYVLEANAGFIEKNKISAETSIVF